MSEPIPGRRCRIDLLTPAETMIREAMIAVENLGGDIRLTQTVSHLQKARDWLADYVDGETWRMEAHEASIKKLSELESERDVIGAKTIEECAGVAESCAARSAIPVVRVSVQEAADQIRALAGK